MTRPTVFAVTIAFSAAIGGAAFADGNHGHFGADRPGAPSRGTQFEHHGNMDDMMRMMMQMHAGVMGDGMGMMNGAMMDGRAFGNGMMDSGMMRMLGADAGSFESPEQMRMHLQAKLTEFDADGNGSLSIAEFETLHSAAIREMMVDRFQSLDADGDGAVTADEMTTPAARMEQMQIMRERMYGSEGQQGMSPGMGNGAMMPDN